MPGASLDSIGFRVKQVAVFLSPQSTAVPVNSISYGVLIPLDTWGLETILGRTLEGLVGSHNIECEEASAGEVLQQLKLVGDAPGGLFMMDRELGKRMFVAPSAESE